ncbi:MAG: hypothetical protein Q9167_007792 [Letrouitia subvulpina]
MAAVTNINLDNLWTHFETAMNNGLTNNIELVAAMKNAIGDAGIYNLVIRYQNMIGAPISVIHNPQSGSVRLVPAYSLDGHHVSFTNIPRPAHVNKIKVARPPNAFIMYRTYHHPIIKAANPNIHNNSISAILGTQWKNESVETKTRFKIAAENVKQEHSAKYPDYQYRPRKPSEKKRRMTRPKTAALLDNASSSEETIESSQVTVPKLDETATGNPTFVLGDQELDDKILSNMLTEFNNSMTNPVDGNTVLYNEADEAAQDDMNFFSNAVNIDPSVLDVDAQAAEWAEIFNRASAEAEQIAAVHHQAEKIAFDKMSQVELHRQNEYYRLLGLP